MLNFTDFYFKNHWDRLPKRWCSSLSELTTEELSFLLDKKPIKLQKVLPLSVLSFKACCDTYSLERECEDNITNKLHNLFNNHGADNGGREETLNDDDSNREASSVQFSPLDDSGQLHAFFKKHVKPKKQHEIKNLAKVVYLLSQHIECKNVVDVGSGLGHLARLLSFGYKLNVTSVEAAGTHAPKASKYDREIDREIKKKILAAKGEDCEHIPVPCHVTSMIYPNMTAEEFIAIVTSQSQQNDNTTSTAEPHSNSDTVLVGNDSDTGCVRHRDLEIKMAQTRPCDDKEMRLVTDSRDKYGESVCDTVESDVIESNNESVNYESNKCLEDCNKRSQDTDNVFDGRKNVKYAKLETKITSDGCIKSGDDSGFFGHYKTSSECDNKSNANCDKNVISNFKSKSAATKIGNIISCDSVKGSDVECNSCVKFSDVNSSKSKDDVNEISYHTSSMANDNYKVQSAGGIDRNNWHFMLTGLHACGDLTPTFLRFFVNCEAAVGLASVGCCYMKISDESCGKEMIGYPLSEYCSSLPHHQQTYASRELACHFADTYSQRLKENPPLLKIHSYRAALEWIANKLCPGFKRTAVQIPTKKMKDLDFKKYVQLGLEKLNISRDKLSEELLLEAEKMTERWKDVVAFYTIRLALAPVVETLVLLDRMMFLYEKGYVSALVPVFDPGLSPRNFVLLSWK